MSKKILIAGNLTESPDIIKLLIEDFGFKTLSAANGNEAIKIGSREVPDIILMDISMLMTDGLTAIEVIRSSAALSEIPILAITSQRYSLADKAIKAGCNEVISKPLDSAKLKPLLTEYLMPLCPGKIDRA